MRLDRAGSGKPCSCPPRALHGLAGGVIAKLAVAIPAMNKRHQFDVEADETNYDGTIDYLFKDSQPRNCSRPSE